MKKYVIKQIIPIMGFIHCMQLEYENEILEVYFNTEKQGFGILKKGRHQEKLKNIPIGIINDMMEKAEKHIMLHIYKNIESECFKSFMSLTIKEQLNKTNIINRSVKLPENALEIFKDIVDLAIFHIKENELLPEELIENIEENLLEAGKDFIEEFEENIDTIATKNIFV